MNTRARRLSPAWILLAALVLAPLSRAQTPAKDLKSKDVAVRLAAVEALGAFGDRRLVPLLSVQLDSERDPEIIAAIVRGIGNARDLSTEPRIMEFCRHESSKVRAAAVEAIGGLE